MTKRVRETAGAKGAPRQDASVPDTLPASASDPVVVPVLVVVPPRALLLDIAGPVEALRRANLEQTAVRFDVRHVAPRATVLSSIGLELASLSPLPETLADGSWIVLAGSVADILGQETRDGNGDAPKIDAVDEQAIVDWLARMVKTNAEGRHFHRIISICSGALLAARAGFLDGRDCTTHHSSTAELAALAPTARVLENRLFVEAGQIWTSAGVTAGIDLMLHLVAETCGPATVLAVARYLTVYLRRTGADPQLSPWLEGRNHVHPAIHRMQDAILSEPTRAWTLKDLADIGHLSPRHCSRLFNVQTGMAIADFVNRARVALARTTLEGGHLDMESVAEKAGFASARQLRRAWGRLHDAPPRESRRKAATGAR